ncbi:hypothetical protein [Geobacter sp. SVR]|uniref:hypothetical protein n=1 Tax=Geobacter sp. SVR TaxID=2495594 RepID=UPI00143EFAE3|nr:hypothetical protein [Geobacter sp. SVR]BCS53117.1 hypothetical protein GSVR_14250 [Geobacter sp. SVR]GCF84502.1 hypothetical protein GSbR_11020 [Geobacter sp. SVR]
MGDSLYEKVCYRTEQQEEHVPVRNVRTGEIGYSYLCTEAGATIQVRLENGELDSWEKEDCAPVTDEEAARIGASGKWTGWDKNDVSPSTPQQKEEPVTCTDEGHEMHMCELKRRGEFDRMKVLSANPMAKCRRCGALARNLENLCEPDQFPDVKDVGDAYEVK